MLLAALVSVSATLTGCDEGGFTTVDERGGWVVSDDGRVSLDVPPDALEGPTDLAIEISDAPHPGGHTTTYTLQPEGMPLLLPATLLFDLDDADANVDLVMRGPDSWAPMADRDISSGARGDAVSVTGSVLYFADVTIVPRNTAKTGATR